MSIEKVREINKDWEIFFGEIFDFDENGKIETSYWHYEPFSDGYWNEKTKIVLCNEEAHGYSMENCVMTLEKFKERIEKYGKDAPTLIHSALFLYCLYKKLHNINITENQLRELYHNNNELLDGIRNTTYMNLRKEEKWKEGANEDTDGIIRSLVHDKKYDERDKDGEYNECNRKLTLKFIDALEPNIFIITGTKTGLYVLKDIYTDKTDKLDGLQKDGMYKTEKTLYVSMEHPSRFSYNYFLEKAKAIYEELQK